MSYFRTELAVNPIEELLNRLEAADAEDLSADNQTPPDVPTLDQFLNEEDVLRECRAVNARLISYLCRPEVVTELVDKSFNVPRIAADFTEPNGRATAVPSSVDEEEDESRRQRPDREVLLKYAYVASELLTSDNKLISDAIVGNDAVMNRIFSCLDESEPGNLNTIVAVHFSKMIVSLLKMKNSKAIEQMAKRGSGFVNSVLRHMDSLPIAELVVRILDSPEPEPAYGTSGNKRPTEEALELLTNCDLLGGLAECFVRASSDSAVSADGAIEQKRTTGAEQNEDSKIDPEEDAKRRRLREETMANVTITILGLTERMLQFPELGCRIPEKLSPYSSPAVITRLLDAGLYASFSRKTGKNEPVVTSDPDGKNAERVEAFSSGNNSALLHSLGLAADLMTTEANVLRDDEDDTAHEVEDAPGIPGRPGGVGMGKSPYSGKGIGPSIAATGLGEAVEDHAEPAPAEEKPPRLAELLDKKVGDPIVETDKLEAELAIRFARLSDMFGDSAEVGDTGQIKPLGSLRLKLAEFFVACMKKAAQETVDQIMDLGVPKKLLDLFGKYQWSSMLHGVVTKSIVSALETAEVGRPSRQAWLKAGLIPWLIDAWSRNTKDEETSARSRAGYMGHLIRIGTSLKAYIEENQNDPNADLPEKSEMETFAVFAEQALAPAHSLEATPLCEGQPESDEGEEARDVLEMGGINFVEGLTQESVSKEPLQIKYSALRVDDDVDEDEEIKPVEVDDLEHFGADDDEDNHIRPVDHDIPAAMRQEFAKHKEDDEVKPVTDPTPVDLSVPSDSLRYESLGGVRFPPQSTVHGDELKEVIDTVDSSSEDEGSYVAFVDDQRESDDLKDVKAATGKLDGLKLSESEPAASSLAGAVTEIEEPGPIAASGTLLPALASNVVSIADDDINSSDEEYEAWEDPARIASSSNSESPAGAKKSTDNEVRKIA